MSSKLAAQNEPNALIEGGIRHWPLFLGLAVLCLPVLAQLGEQAWTQETGVHGPLILATWLWLLYRGYDENRALVKPGRLGVALAAIIPALLFFIATWAFDFISLFRSEEHTSELQSLMRISYAVFCLKKKISQE